MCWETNGTMRMPENDTPRTVSAFEHENALMHYGRVNKRMLVALLSICVTFIVVTLIFVTSYTAREQSSDCTRYHRLYSK